MPRFIFITLFYAVVSCAEKGTVSADEISGTYVKEVDFEVPDPYNIEKTLGMGKIRDTIFISAKQDGFEVSNNKWRLNDYDDLGWQNLEFEENRPMPTYKVIFDPSDSSLNPVLSGLFLPFKLDLKNGRLQKGKFKSNVYVLVR